jgi:hypothetical protein
VADAPRTQSHRLDHALGGIASPGVQRQRQAGITAQGQRPGMVARRMAGLGAGQVESDHAAALVAQGQPRGTQGFAFWQVAHRAKDQARGQRAARQARQQGLDDGLGGQAVGLEEQRRNAELRQHAAVFAGVLGGLEGRRAPAPRAGQRCHRQREAPQVLGQAAGVRARIEPARQAADIGSRRVQIARAQQLEQGCDTQAAVQNARAAGPWAANGQAVGHPACAHPRPAAR